MLNKIFSSVLLLTLLVSCADQTKDKKTFVVKLENGRKAVITGYVNGTDTILDGVTRYYHSNGVIVDEYNYLNNIKEGWQYHYDTFGTIQSKIYFKANVADGEGLFFDRSGVLISKSVFIKGRQYFVTQYFADGRISGYIAMNDTLPFYQVLYKENGDKAQEKGYVISIDEGCFSNNLDSLKVGQPMYAKIPFAAIPGYSSIIEIAKFDSTGRMMGVPDTAVNHSFYGSVNIQFESTGKYRLGVAGQLRRKDGQVIRNDTLLVRVTVIK